MKKYSFLFVFVFLVCHFLPAQDPVLRKSVLLPSEVLYEKEVALPLGEQGVVVAAINSEMKGKNGAVRVWYCNKELDLVKTWDNTYAYDIREISLLQASNSVYLQTHGWKCEYDIHKMEISSLKNSKLSLPLEGRCGIGSLAVSEDKLVGVSYDKEAYYTEISPGTGTKQDVIMPGKGETVLSLEVDPVHNLTGIFIQKSYGRFNAAHAMKFFSQGKLTIDLAMDETNKNKVFTATFAELPDGSILVCGVYNSKTYSGYEGIYVAKIKDGVLGETKYYHFTSFKRYFEFLKEGAQERMSERAERANSTNTSPEVNQDLWMHHLHTAHGKYYLIGEAYYAEFTEAGGNQIFSGNRYTHATIVCLDAQGNIVWDQIMRVTLSNTNLPKEEKRYARALFLKDRIVLFYAVGNTVCSKTIGLDGQELTPYACNDTKGPNGEELPRATSTAEPWHSNHFIVFGRRDGPPGTGKKEVVYLEDFTCGN
jgi:hypothetical protein